jgi:protein-S-isoprenylcysteine O-methyltransferase Ste14
MTIGQAVLFILASCCFASYIWALRCFFLKPCQKDNYGMTLIYIFGTIFTVIHLFSLIFFYHTNSVALIIGSILYVLSFGLFWWSIYATQEKPFTVAFSSDVPIYIKDEGPYKLVRHPFYTSYLLTWAAGAFAVQKLPIFISVLVMFGLYWCAACFEEKKFMASPLAAFYRDYKTRVGMFFPKIF